MSPGLFMSLKCIIIIIIIIIYTRTRSGVLPLSVVRLLYVAQGEPQPDHIDNIGIQTQFQRDMLIRGPFPISEAVQIA